MRFLKTFFGVLLFLFSLCIVSFVGVVFVDFLQPFGSLVVGGGLLVYVALAISACIECLERFD